MHNIVLCGFMGCGKTTVGTELATIMNYDFIDTDELIEKKQETTIKEIFETHGEAYFRDLEHEACKKVADMKNCVISTGGGAMTFKRNVEAIKKGSKVFFLDASFSVISERIGADGTRPLFKDRDKAKHLYEERKEKYIAAADYIIDANMSVNQIVLNITDILKELSY